VRAAFAGSGLPVAQLMRMDLGGDGGMFDLIEARQEGIRFSQTLPNQPALLVTNAIEPWDDTRYALNDRYRRELQLLNPDFDLDALNDTFNLGQAPALPAKGITVKILGIRNVPRPFGVVTRTSGSIGRAIIRAGPELQRTARIPRVNRLTRASRFMFRLKTWSRIGW